MGKWYGMQYDKRYIKPAKSQQWKERNTSADVNTKVVEAMIHSSLSITGMKKYFATL